jgi:hypothetical protein
MGPDTSQVTGQQGAAAEAPENHTDAILLADGALAQHWLNALGALHRGHWEAARRYDRLSIWLGIATAVTAGISGASVVTELASNSGSTVVKTVIGVFSVLTAVLAALQSFTKTAEFGSRHKAAAGKFGQLRRELQRYREVGIPAGKSLREALDELDGRWKTAEEDVVPLPAWAYEKAKLEREKRASAGAERSF